jgi:hypothetical protein
MRTTVRLPPDLLAAAKLHASETGRTLTALLEDALRLALSAERPTSGHLHESLPTYGGGGVVQGVDLDDSAALLDRRDQGR